jgi:hypothetical protein
MTKSHDRTRRLVSTGLGLLPLAPLLHGCGGGSEDAERIAALGDVAGSDPSEAPRARVMALPQATNTGPLRHPGMLHTEADFSRIRPKLWSAAQPWQASWSSLLNNGLPGPGTGPFPRETVIRGAPGDNVGTMIFDIQRAYANALHWKLTGDLGCANFAVQILNAWGSTLKQLSNASVDVYLVAGLQGYQWANVAEIMRTYPGWAAADQQQFGNMLLNVFYPFSSSFLAYQATRADPTYVFASWDLLSMCGIMAIGIFCDRRSLYDEALNYFYAGRGNGSSLHSTYVVHPGYLGQYMESGRDQGHATLGIGLHGVLCEMAWNQGDDLYGYQNNRVLMAAEYVARSNLRDANGNFHAMPFTPQPNVWAGGGWFTSVSDAARPSLRLCWEVIYNHYVNRKGLSAPNVTAMVKAIGVEASPRGGDDLGYGTLLFRRDPYAGPAAPTGLTACLVNGAVQLSWWGCVGATSYAVQRAAAETGPFATLATVTEPCTYADTVPAAQFYYRIVANLPGGRTAPSSVLKFSAGTVRYSLPLNGGSGTVLNEVVGGRNANLVGAGGYTTGRKAGTQALSLSGGYAVLPADLLTGFGDFTLSVWVYWHYEQTDTPLLFFRQDGLSGLYLTPRAYTGTCTLGMSKAGKGQGIKGPILPTRRWVHLAVTLNGGDACMYFDGRQVAQASGWQYQPWQIGPTVDNWIGTDGGDGGHAHFDGKLQELQIYNRALLPAEVAALAAS